MVGSYFDWWPVQGWSPACDAQRGQTADGSAARGVDRDDVREAVDRVADGDLLVRRHRPRRRARAGVWRLLYKDGDEWRPVETSDAFGVAKDGWNKHDFTPVNTTALRLEVVMQPTFSAGVQEWKVK